MVKLMDNPIKMDDLGVPLFLETPIWMGVSTSNVSQQDNGDGQITLSEFIDGAARLRGGAKALDIWRRLGSRKTRPKKWPL